MPGEWNFINGAYYLDVGPAQKTEKNFHHHHSSASFTFQFHNSEPLHLHIALSTSFLGSEAPTLTGT
jgi:hypothetical protein